MSYLKQQKKCDDSDPDLARFSGDSLPKELPRYVSWHNDTPLPSCICFNLRRPVAAAAPSAVSARPWFVFQTVPCHADSLISPGNLLSASPAAPRWLISISEPTVKILLPPWQII